MNSIRTIIALAFFGAAVVGYGVWYAVIAEASSRAAGLKQEVDTRTLAVERANAVETTLGKLSQSSIEDYFISENNIVTFLTELESVGTSTGATVDVSSVGAPQAGAGRQVLALSVTISGSFTAVMQSLGALEYAPYDLTISSVMLSKGNKEDPNQWQATAQFLAGSGVKLGAPAAAAATEPASKPQ